MPAQPCVRGLLRIESLLELRSQVEHEVVASVRAGADQRTLNTLVGVLDRIDQRVEHRSATANRTFENRARVADKGRTRQSY